MKNSDMPAMPSEMVVPTKNSMGHGTKKQIFAGLTKREYFAGLAMQGLIALKGSDCLNSDVTAKQCARMADALLKELEK